MTETTTLNISIGADREDASARRLAIEIEPGLALWPTIRLRVYPHDVERFAVSSGKLTREDNGDRLSIESLQFSGSDLAPLKYWCRTPPEILYKEVFFDQEGEVVTGTRFSWDAERGGLRASRAVYAILQVRYQAPFARYRYVFDRDPPRPAMALAIEGKRSAVLDLELPEAGADDKYVELYRVTSQIVTDPSGSWEFPPDFPDDGTFPGGITGPDTGIYMISERTHESAVLRVDGNIDERRYYINYEQPFTGSPNYKPDWRLQRGNPPPGYESLWLDVDWNSIEDILNKRYPGLVL